MKLQLCLLLLSMSGSAALMIGAVRSLIAVKRRGRSSLIGSRRRSSSSSSALQVSSELPRKLAVLGGGLAGLSTVYFILNKSREYEITVFDKAAVGCSGASSVAGGYVVACVRRTFLAAGSPCVSCVPPVHQSMKITIYLLLLIEPSAHDDCLYHQDR